METTSTRKPIVKTDYDIPRFSFKGAFYVILAGVISTLLVPFALSFIGVPTNIAIVLSNTLILGYSISYIRFFVDTKRGFCNKFWYTFAFNGLAFGVISYFWLFLDIYL